jgi:3-oxoacyl-[acyl-carrier protein] reductase
MRSVIVTGASRGLGLEIACKLKSAGYRVIAVARHESEGLVAAGLDFRRYDLAEIGGLGGLVKGIRKDFGAIYGLVNNAAIGTDGLLATMPDSAIERLVRINALSPLVLTKYAVRAMLAAGGGGRVVNVASIAAFTGYAGLAPYSATKASLLGMTRALAREIGAAGITVNAVAPGFMATDMTHGLDEGERDRIVRRSALHRLTEPADVADAVEFFMSDKAKTITGTVLTIDAGSTA